LSNLCRRWFGRFARVARFLRARNNSHCSDPPPLSRGTPEVLLLFGIMLLGLAHLAVLPPWEGFDETAHYAYMQQLADDRQLPRYGTAHMAVDVELYGRVGPLPYSGVPPFEQREHGEFGVAPGGGISYRQFFASSTWRDTGSDAIHGSPVESRAYRPAEAMNWQAQHPPLYYALVAPVYAATKNMSWADHLLALRFVSYLFAVCAIVIGARTLTNQRAMPARWLPLGVLLWPFLFPMWFPEMARLGNDSLVALGVAVSWALLVRYTEKPDRTSALLIGLVLGLGCLTKAIFVPIAAGVVLFLGLRAVFGMGGVAQHRKRPWIDLVLILTTTAGLSGWWYVQGYLTHGSILGSDELIRLANQGGLAGGLSDKFSLLAWLRGMSAVAASFTWAGTWSLARPPHLLLAPLVLLAATLFTAYLFEARRHSMLSIIWAPLYLTGPVVLGLAYHVLMRIAFSGMGVGTSGWYLHALVAPLGLAVGIGLSVVAGNRWLRVLTAALVTYVLVFTAAVVYMQLLLFTGCAFKAGAIKTYQIPADARCLTDIAGGIERLSAIANPAVGMTAGATGLAVVVLSLLWVVRRAGSAADNRF